MTFLLLFGCVGSVHVDAIVGGFGPVMSAAWVSDSAHREALLVTNVTGACDKWTAAFAARNALTVALEEATDADSFCADMKAPVLDYAEAMGALQHAGVRALALTPEAPFVATTYPFEDEVIGILERYTTSGWSGVLDGWDAAAGEEDACGGVSLSPDLGAEGWVIGGGDLVVTSFAEGESLAAEIDAELRAEEGPIAARFTAERCELGAEWSLW